jgi:hypothetical protein
MSKHFVAIIDVTKVINHEGTGRGDDKRLVGGSFKLTVRDESLEGLTKKVTAHLSLVEELEFDL